jgi:hypothetical protein
MYGAGLRESERRGRFRHMRDCLVPESSKIFALFSITLMWLSQLVKGKTGPKLNVLFVLVTNLLSLFKIPI